MSNTDYDVVVIGGGPSGASAAEHLAKQNYRVLLLERAFRIKPCGGAIPPCLIDEFEIPEDLLVARIRSARMISPTEKKVDMPVGETFVGMVDRDVFDPWLRERAVTAGAELRIGAFKALHYDDDGVLHIDFQSKESGLENVSVTTRSVIGADGARSNVSRQAIPCSKNARWVLAYHEIVEAPAANDELYDGDRCDVWYQGDLSPDFYALVFPHCRHASIGVGSETDGFSARNSVETLRAKTGLDT